MKTKKFALVFLFFLPFIIKGQTTDSVSVKKFALGIIGSPIYSYRYLRSDGSEGANVVIQERNSTEIPKYGYSAGLEFTFFLRPKIMLKADVCYSDKGYKTKSMDLVFGSMIDPRRGLINNSAGGSAIMTYTYQYIDVPVSIGYVLRVKKFGFYATAGPVMNIYIGSVTKSVLTNNDGTTSTTTYKSSNELSNVGMSFNAGLGVNYDISKKIYITLNPFFEGSVIPIVANVPVKEYLYSPGINAGANYRF